jgi:hypothetical protein
VAVVNNLSPFLEMMVTWVGVLSMALELSLLVLAFPVKVGDYTNQHSASWKDF